MAKIQAFIACESGATAIEYVLMAFAIGGVITITVYALGDTVLKLWELVPNAFVSPNP
ncbi:MAG: Flp family type IVb pilin [Pseudomonadota bacterium]